MTRCPSSELLQQLLAERLSGRVADAVETHVEACAACQQALEVLTGATTRKGAAPESAGAPGGDFLRRLEKEPPPGAWCSPGQNHQAILMHGPDAVPKHPSAGEPTVDEGEGGATPGRPARRLQIAPRPGLGPNSSGEVQALLRKRLGFLALALSLLGAINLPVLLLLGVGIGVSFGVNAVVPAVAVVAAWILRSTRPLSLRQLRVIEFLVFGTFVAFGAWVHYRLFDRAWSFWNRDSPLFANLYPVLLAQAEGGAWAFLIVLYGIFIPNTWRRCAAVVGIMAAIPLGLSAASGLAGATLEGQALLKLLTVMSFWLALAVAVAIHGSHRIEVLRQEAVAARRLGQYQLKQRLGAGGMGEVYLAEHVLLRRPCAIKLIRPERAGDPRNLARFEREVQATAALTHPNTVEIFDYGHTADGTFYYVMEYLPGLSLDELVQRHGPLPPERTVHLLRQVCAALREAHAAGLIHRDIKPGNVLVCRRGGRHDVAKLLDFGLVQAHSLSQDGQQLTQEGAIAGTPAYMSPEQAAARGNLDARSDLYSLGALAYFLLTGQPPFVCPTAVQTLAAHLGEAVVPPDWHRPDIPADVRAVVLRCLEKEPARRFQDAAGLEQALDQCACASRWTQEEAAAWWCAATAVENLTWKYPQARSAAAPEKK
jgi:serine/threonine-protein kinase